MVLCPKHKGPREDFRCVDSLHHGINFGSMSFAAEEHHEGRAVRPVSKGIKLVVDACDPRRKGTICLCIMSFNHWAPEVGGADRETDVCRFRQRATPGTR